MTPENRQTPPDLIRLLAMGLTYKQAAIACGISPKTVERRMAEDSFREQVREFRDQAYSQAIGSLQALSADAVRTLRKLMKSGTEKVRLGAAQTVLSLSLRSRELLTLEERIAKLERRKHEKP